MGQYKGKREAPKSENGILHWHAADNAQDEKMPQNDPFAEEKPSLGERFEYLAEDISRFFRSKAGKTVTTVLCCVLALVVGGVIAFKGWVKPPELPDGNDPVVQNPNNGQGDQTPSAGDSDTQEPQGPTDDELYPDDGYDGDMPEVSGERKEGVYTFLLVGTDMDDGNTDTIMVATYDTINQTVNVMSIPRDTMINESWDIKKINSVYSRTGNSINSLANRVKKLIGFKPDFYVKVELSMFVELVDLVDGVDFYVPRDMDYDDDWQDLHIHLKKGQQTLDGDKAMQLVRFRGYGDGDIGRVAVQQDFLKALIKECLSFKHWGKMKAYIELAMDNVETDLEFGSIVWFAANVMGLNEAPMLDMNNVNTHTLPGNYYDGTWSRTFPNAIDRQSYVTIYPNQVVKLVNESFNPYKQKVTTDMLDAMSILDNDDIASSTGTLKDTKHNEWMAVRRGEAYYDEQGNIVYGDPNGETGEDPMLPGTDPTDPSVPGTDPSVPGTDPADPSVPGTDPSVPGTDPSLPDTGSEDTSVPGEGEETDPSVGSDPSAGTDTGDGSGDDVPAAPDAGDGDIGEEPTLPGEGESEGENEGESEDDNEMPEWLRPRQ